MTIYKGLKSFLLFPTRENNNENVLPLVFCFILFLLLSALSFWVGYLNRCGCEFLISGSL